MCTDRTGMPFTLRSHGSASILKSFGITSTPPDTRARIQVTDALLIALSGVILATPVSAQSAEAANTKTGSILGKVVDPSDDSIPGAIVVLQGPVGDRLTAVTKDDGAFAVHDVLPGTDYQITVTAEGFADWSSPVTPEMLSCELYAKNSTSFIEAIVPFFASGICRSYRLHDQDGILFRLLRGT